MNYRSDLVNNILPFWLKDAIDYKNGGISLCRDSFHLSEDYGRFLAGAVWFKKLTGKTLKKEAFLDFDSEKVKMLIKTVNEKV
jgi:hypothetical protein